MQLELRTAHGLFSADRLDEGTRLLLSHLPERELRTVLDVGCGYGALGLPIAAALPDARVLCVDRDLVAARFCAHNARLLELGNVEARPSLGYDEVGEQGLDLVLCNVPARIGREGIRHLVEGGARRASSHGEVRIVVIRDLRATVEALARERNWSCSLAAEGPRHDVFAIGPQVPEAAEDAALYARDEVELAGLRFARPHDASEDPGHAKEAVPLLVDLLPRAPRGDALVWRSAHGVASTVLALRGASVLAADRDLLALAFARKNAARHGAAIETRAAGWLPELAERTYSLVVVELSATAGPTVASFELDAARRAIAKDGRAIILALDKIARPLRESPARPAILGQRGAWTVLGIA